MTSTVQSAHESDVSASCRPLSSFLLCAMLFINVPYIPYVPTSTHMEPTSRAIDCFVDAPDAASLEQHVRLCLSMMILSELSVGVFVLDSTFMSMCCNFHALTLYYWLLAL